MLQYKIKMEDHDSDGNVHSNIRMYINIISESISSTKLKLIISISVYCIINKVLVYETRTDNPV